MNLTVTALASSSAGNALLLRAGQAALLVDCGLPLRTLEPLLCYAGAPPETLQAVLLTHEHGDHIQGAGTLARRYGVPLLCNDGTRAALEERLRRAPVELLPTGQTGQVGGFEVCSFPVSHDAAAPVGYRIRAAGTTVGVATDLGSWDAALVAALRPADLLVLEANHDRARLLASSYPWVVCQRIVSPLGHLDNEQAGALLAAIAADGRPRHVRLAHLSEAANSARHALRSVRSALRVAGYADWPVHAWPRQARRTRKGMPVWSSSHLMQQSCMF